MIGRIETGAVIPRTDTLDRLLEHCGSGLYARARTGIGVDRPQIQEVLELTPSLRNQVSEQDAHALYEAKASLRSRAVAYEAPPPAYRTSIFETLAAYGVNYVLIGGVAGNVHGSPIVTNDVDICYQRDKDNLKRLGDALVEMRAYPRGWPEDMPFVPDERTLRKVELLALNTVFGALDCLASPAGVNGYEELARTALRVTLSGASVQVASLDALIRMKEAAGRPKDRWAVEILGALQEEIDRNKASHRRRKPK